MKILLIFLLFGACVKKKKPEELQSIPRDTGLITEEELEELPER